MAGFPSRLSLKLNSTLNWRATPLMTARCCVAEPRIEGRAGVNRSGLLEIVTCVAIGPSADVLSAADDVVYAAGATVRERVGTPFALVGTERLARLDLPEEPAPAPSLFELARVSLVLDTLDLILRSSPPRMLNMNESFAPLA
eukprot:6257029-Prymnesium_polylepis.2